MTYSQTLTNSQALTNTTKINKRKLVLNNQHKNKVALIRRSLGLWLFVLVVFFGNGLTQAQNTPFPPPNQIQVFGMQELNFGSLSTGASGGSVVINHTGSRSSTGSVILMGGGYNQAIFEIKLIPGRLVQIIMGPQVQLNRIGGGGSMNMQVGPSDKGTSFVTNSGHPFYNPVQVGGTLYVGNSTANPAGAYEGQFSVTFIQE